MQRMNSFFILDICFSLWGSTRAKQTRSARKGTLTGTSPVPGAGSGAEPGEG
jgi:hypothetical protein